MLRLEGLTIAVTDKIIIKNLNLKLEKNKVYVLMGPNGSGKSTLALSLMGHPLYQVRSGKIILEKQNITEMEPDKRANAGIFLSFQSPLSLSGINIFSLLRTAVSGKKDPLALKEEIEKTAKLLKIKDELLERSFNEGTSGGEKKKLEILQMKLLSPALLILDEVDSGLDIDALKTIAMTVHKEIKKRRMSALVITHYQRLLKFLVPDRVVIMKKGEIVDKGGADLVERLEKEGYKAYE